MKYFWLLLLFCLATWQASAQGPSTSGPVLDEDLDAKVFVMTGFILLCNFVVIAIKLILNYLLKKQMVAAATSESIVERLLPVPQNEQNKVVKWVALLLSTGTGLALCSRYLPWELHPLIILLFSTAGGLLAYYLFLRYQAKAK
jgi:O-antigen/teichoic acid export membrane protein